MRTFLLGRLDAFIHDAQALLRLRLLLLLLFTLFVIFLTHFETSSVRVPKVVPGEDCEVVRVVQLQIFDQLVLEGF